MSHIEIFFILLSFIVAIATVIIIIWFIFNMIDKLHDKFKIYIKRYKYNHIPNSIIEEAYKNIQIGDKFVSKKVFKNSDLVSKDTVSKVNPWNKEILIDTYAFEVIDKKCGWVRLKCPRSKNTFDLSIRAIIIDYIQMNK